MTKFHMNLTSGSYRHPFLYFDYKPKGDIYIPLLPSSSSGLHMSFHKDFFMLKRVHISDNYGFNEWANIKIKSETNELESYLSKMAYNPDHGEDVFVLSNPENYENCYQQRVSAKNVNIDINMNEFMNNFSINQVPVEILPKYFQASPLETHTIIDTTTNSIAFYNMRKGISLNFSMEISSIEKQIESMPFLKDIMPSMKRAIYYTNELVSQKKIPEYQIFPKEIIPKKTK